MALRFLGFLTIVTFIAVLWFAFMKIHNEEYEYDERQQRVQGNSYRIITWLFVIYCIALYGCDSLFNLTKFIEFKGYIIIGLTLCGCIFDGYNLLNGAYYYPKFKKRIRGIVSAGLMIITWSLNVKLRSDIYGTVNGGMIPTQVVFGVSMLIMVISHFVLAIFTEIRERKVTE